MRKEFAFQIEKSKNAFRYPNEIRDAAGKNERLNQWRNSATDSLFSVTIEIIEIRFFPKNVKGGEECKNWKICSG